MKGTTSVILLVLGLICSTFAYTTVLIGAPGATMTFDTVLGQASLSSADNQLLRSPASLVYNPRGGLYVTDNNGNNGGRVFYYANPAVNTPSFVLGAADFNQSAGQLGSPSGLGLYTTGGVDQYIAVATRSGFTKFYNLTNGNNQNTQGSDYVGVIGSTAISTSNSYLQLAVDNNSGELYVADQSNNRVAGLPNNATSLPLVYYGAGANDGLSSSCNNTVTTCFTSPVAVAVDCNRGVWISVTAVNGTPIGAGVLYFPYGSRIATALYLPNSTADFTPSYIFTIAFNADCSRIAFAGSYRVYTGSLSLGVQGVPTISGVSSLGIYSSSQAIPAATASSDSLSIVQAVAFDPTNNARLAIADQFHNRVVIGTVPGAGQTSASASSVNSATGLPSTSQIPSRSNLTVPSASNITLPSASNLTVPSASNLTVPSRSNLTIPSASNLTLPSASNLTVASPSPSNLTVASASASNLTVASASPSAFNNSTFGNSSSPSATSAASLTPQPSLVPGNDTVSPSRTPRVSTTSTFTYSFTYSGNITTQLPSYTQVPNNRSDSDSQYFSATASPVYPDYITGSGSVLNSWVQLFAF